MLYANLLLNVLYHIEIEMKIRESCLQTGNFIYKPGISLTKQDFHLQRGILGLQRGFSGYYLPAMNVLAIVRSVWKEVLNNEQILDTDNFFELGGDSISSLRASLKLRDYGIFVPADSLFHYQSITELVNYIKSIGINQGKIREE